MKKCNEEMNIMNMNKKILTFLSFYNIVYISYVEVDSFMSNYLQIQDIDDAEKNSKEV